jgi:hypothetical protein
MKKVVVIGLFVVLLFSVLGSAMYDWRIFVSDIEFDGKLTAANRICQEEATSAGIDSDDTEFVALISTSNKDAIDIIWEYGKITDITGRTVADSRDDLFSGKIKFTPFEKADGSEYSGYVWTGSESDGRIYSGLLNEKNCIDWTSNRKYEFVKGVQYGAKGDVGRSQKNADYDKWFEHDNPISCDNIYSVYCIEVPKYCVDNDGDGYYNSSVYNDVVLKWMCGTEKDCDDTNPDVNPGYYELCGDGIDNDCKNGIDSEFKYYHDYDGDGWGVGELVIYCSRDLLFYSKQHGDCNESNPKINPSMPEICNGIDDNCKDGKDEGGVCDCGDCGLGKRCSYGQCISCTDSDGDGYYVNYGCGKNVDCDDTDFSLNWNDNDGDGLSPCSFYKDCDDTNPDVNSYISIDLCDGMDNDCDGEVDENPDIVWYKDTDNDGYPYSIKDSDNNFVPYHTLSCKKPSYFSKLEKDLESLVGDYDDKDGDTYPGAPEKCDMVDNDDDGEIDEGLGGYYYPDMDGDGFGDQDGVFSCGAKSGYVDNNFDCDDFASWINPTWDEKCDGIDNNCNGEIDEGLDSRILYQDIDGDGVGNKNILIESCKDVHNGIKYVEDFGDCNDGSSLMSPNLDENCSDPYDNDCSGNATKGCPELCDDKIDNDGDGKVNEDCCGNGALDWGEVCDGDEKKTLIDIFDCTNGNCYSIYESEGLGQWNNIENVNACYVYSDKIMTDGLDYIEGYGELQCGTNCGYITAAKCEVSYCGNGEIEGDEECDTKGFGSISCSSLNSDYVSGLLKCDSECKYDISSCKLITCGNGKLDKGEDCDAGDLNSESCGTQGYTKGSLSCNSNTCKFDYSSCESVCGNDVKEIGEVCDGSDIVGKTCAASNYAKGTVECSVGCDKFEYSKCDKIFCGDGICSRGESKYCDADCAVNKPTGTFKRSSVNVCGDGKLGIYEQCDEELLGEMDCVDFDFTSGVLSCNDECIFDVSGCSYEGKADSENKQEISEIIKKLNTAILTAKSQNMDTTRAEALLLEAIKDYASGEDHTVVSAKLSDVETLLAGGEIQEKSDLPFEYIFGVIILGLVLMLVFVLRGLGGREDEVPKEEPKAQ